MVILGTFQLVVAERYLRPYGRGHLGWPPCRGPWRWSQEGGLRPDRRDLGATEEQDEGSTEPEFTFLQRVKVSSVMGSQYLIVVEFLKRPVRRKISKCNKLYFYYSEI